VWCRGGLLSSLGGDYEGGYIKTLKAFNKIRNKFENKKERKTIFPHVSVASFSFS